MISRALDFYKKDECTKFYKFGKTLGQGSFATVKAVVCKADDTKWAIKCINKQSLAPEDEEALRVEVQILESVSHPNIVSLKEVFDCSKTFYMVMEVMTGGELFDRIVDREKYTEKEASNVIRKLCVAIDYCHDRGIVHRDLKPENLLYQDETEESQIKIADFGLAKLLTGDAMMQTACGTPGYVAPEILEGQTYDKAVDMWSIGVIAYILLCGFPPFYDENNAALFAAIKSGSFDYPSPYWDAVSDEAKDLIDKLLVVNPADRFTCKDVLKHGWITGEVDNSRDISVTLAELRRFNARRKFRAGVMKAKIVRRMGGFGAGGAVSDKNAVAAAANPAAVAPTK